MGGFNNLIFLKNKKKLYIIKIINKNYLIIITNNLNYLIFKYTNLSFSYNNNYNFKLWNNNIININNFNIFQKYKFIKYLGKSFKIKKYNKLKKIKFKFNCSHPCIMLYFNFIIKKKKKNKYFFIYKNIKIINNIIKNFYKIRFTNKYTKRGLRLSNMKIKKRFGKISQAFSLLH